MRFGDGYRYNQPQPTDTACTVSWVRCRLLLRATSGTARLNFWEPSCTQAAIRKDCSLPVGRTQVSFDTVLFPRSNALRWNVPWRLCLPNWRQSRRSRMPRQSQGTREKELLARGFAPPGGSFCLRDLLKTNQAKILPLAQPLG